MAQKFCNFTLGGYSRGLKIIFLPHTSTPTFAGQPTNGPTNEDHVPDSFTPTELSEISSMYRTSTEAVQLLDAVGFPGAHIPTFTTSSVFWNDINRQLSHGRMADGKEKIWAQVLIDFPAIQPNVPSNQQGATASQNNPPPSGNQATTQTQPSQTPPEPPGSKTVIRAAIIAAGSAIIVALIALIPSFIGGDDAKDREPPSPSQSSSQSALNDPNGGITGTPALIRPSISINPASGRAQNADIKVRATGFMPNEQVKIEFYQGTGLTNFDGPYNTESTYQADKNGAVAETVTIPSDVCCSGGKIIVRVTSVERHSKASDQTPYTLT